MITTSKLKQATASTASIDGLKDALDTLRGQQEARARALTEALLALPRRRNAAALASLHGTGLTLAASKALSPMLDTFAAHCRALSAARITFLPM